MEFIPEAWIDEAATALSASPEAYEAAVEELREQRPLLLAYCFTEDFEAFTAAEQQYFLYLLLVIWKAVSRSAETLPNPEQQDISLIEEKNWSKLQSSKGKTFRTRLDVFFDGYPQEDLLAFAEDALTQDEEAAEVVSREGQEALFVSLKTMIDALTEAEQA